MKVFERVTGFSMTDNEKERVELVYLYDQPTWRRGVYVLAREADKLTYKNPVGKLLSKWVDDVAIWNHERTCNGDCSVFYKRLPGDPPGAFEMTPDRAAPGCGYMPPTNQVDLKLYDMSIKDSTFVAKYEKTRPRSSAD